MRRVIVCGSRVWHDRQRIQDVLCDVALAYRGDQVTIVHGNARGADRLAHDEALKAGLLVEAHPASWERYGKRAGLVRNKIMAELGADLCLAFWDGRSTGTRHMVTCARDHGIPVRIIS